MELAPTSTRGDRGAPEQLTPVSPAPSQDDVTLATRVCWVESGYSHPDCAAEIHVLLVRAKRAGSTFAEMAVAYSAIDADNTRAAFARQLPAHLGAKDAARWEALRKVAGGVLAGTVKSVCPGASHWGARNLPRDAKRAMDAVKAGRWRAVRCRTQTANAYYAELPTRAVAKGRE